MKYVVEVEPARPAKNGRPVIGPAYRSIYAKEGFAELPPGINTCWDVFRSAVDTYPDNPMLGHRENVDGKAGGYVWLSYKEVYDKVVKLGNAMRSCGVEKGGRCGIYGANSPQWIISLEACNAHGILCVPLYDTLGAGAVEFIIRHAEVSITFVETKKIPELLNALPNIKEYLKTLVSFGKVTPEQKEEVSNHGLTIYAWDEFLEMEVVEEYKLPEKKKSDICTIMYTSGTTGDPKGVLIPNGSIVAAIAGLRHHMIAGNIALHSEDVYLSYLPLAHIFDLAMVECNIYHGARIGFWRGDIKFLLEDIAELRPTEFCAVPRVLDRIYSGLQQKLAAGGRLKQAIFNMAYNYKLGNMKKGWKHSEAAPIFDKIVFNKIKQGLGGRVRLIIAGAAPLSTHVETFLRVVTCAHILQGFGLTETCAATFLSIPNELQMISTVGPPIPIVDVCLESVPEMNYDALASTPQGEVCIRGKTLFSGYHKREDLTNEVVVDGWFHTGDIGEWQTDGSLKIIDRKKNIFKLSQGEYVAVENLENIYGVASVLDSIWVYGNSFRSFLVAVVVPKKQALEAWAEGCGLSGDFKSLCENPKAKAFIIGELNKIGEEKKLRGFEFIKAVHLDPVPFGMERDLLTPTFKKKRPQLLKYYQNVIDEMYKIAR